MGVITRMRRGTVNAQSFTTRRQDGSLGTQGPYYLYSRTEQRRSYSQRIPAGAVETAARRGAAAVTARAVTRRPVIPGDGAPWIWNLVSEYFPAALQILAALAGQYRTRRDSAKRHEVRMCIGYFWANRRRMRYPAFRAQGLCTSTAVVEAGCKVAIGTRLKRTGTHWKVRNRAGEDIRVDGHQLSTQRCRDKYSRSMLRPRCPRTRRSIPRSSWTSCGRRSGRGTVGRTFAPAVCRTGHPRRTARP